LRALILLAVLVIGGCATTADETPENLPESERVGMMQRLGTALRSACGQNNECYGMAARFAGFLWEYRESFSVQTRVYRCVGQYALREGYGWGARRFVGQIRDDTQATGMVTYLYECAVPSWARGWFDGEENEPPVPPGEIRTAPAPGAMTAGDLPAASPLPSRQPTRSTPAATGLDIEGASRASRLFSQNRANADTAP
jgi:hypothetical protein